MAYTSTTTNLSLETLNVENNITNDFPELVSTVNNNANALETIFASKVTIATNPSIVDVAGAKFIELYACSAGSIASITGAISYVPFTMVMRSDGASLALLDAGTNNVLSANWIPSTDDSNITLVWDGTKYIEIGRVTAT
jgi:hypothetical protein